MKNWLFVLYLVASTSSASSIKTIKIVAWDKITKAEVIEEISSSDYSKMLNQTKAQVSQLVVESFDGVQLRAFNYSLKTIVFGIGASGEIGLGPWKFGTGFRQRFYFKR
jgi:hypothetical protein